MTKNSSPTILSRFYELIRSVAGIERLRRFVFAYVKVQIVVKPFHLQKALAADDIQQMVEPIGQGLMTEFSAH